MNIFSNTAVGFNREIDNTMSVFKSTIVKLKATSEKITAIKAEKQDEIKMLELECSALDEVSTKANNLITKLEALFK